MTQPLELGAPSVPQRSRWSRPSCPPARLGSRTLTVTRDPDQLDGHLGAASPLTFFNTLDGFQDNA